MQAASATDGFSFTPITKHIYQGSAPPSGRKLRELGFDVLVLCAAEYQPKASEFPGLTAVIHAPNDDRERPPPTAGEIAIAKEAARHVVKYVKAGKSVIVTCMAGRNRSGLVTAIALHLLTGRSGLDCARHVAKKREGALTNPAFWGWLSRIPRKPAH